MTRREAWAFNARFFAGFLRPSGYRNPYKTSDARPELSTTHKRSFTMSQPQIIAVLNDRTKAIHKPSTAKHPWRTEGTPEEATAAQALITLLEARR